MRMARLVAIVISVAFALACLPGTAAKPEERITRLLAAIRKAPVSLQSELAVLDILAAREVSDPVQVNRALEEVIAVRGLAVETRDRARTCLARSLLRSGEHERASRIWKEMGFIEGWAVSGPFDNEGGTGFGSDLQALAAATAPLDPDDEMDGKTGPVRWRPAPMGLSSFGVVHMDSLSTSSQVCLVAATAVVSETEGAGVLRMGAAGAVRAFFNGVEVIHDPSYYGEESPDRNAARVRVRRGANRLVVAVCSDEQGSAGFGARLTRKDGEPWPIAIDPTLDGALGEEVTPASPGRAKMDTSLDRFLARAAQGSHPPRMTAAARFAMATGSTHPGSHEERNLARRACELSRSADDCLAWAAISLDHNERLQATSAALAADPDSPEALVAMARLRLESPSAHAAYEDLHKVLDEDPDNLEALVLMARLDTVFGFPLKALQDLRDITVRFPGRLMTADAAADIAQQAGAARAAMEMNTAASMIDWADLPRHQILARAAAARGDEAELKNHIEAMELLGGHDRSNLWELARLREMIGDLEASANTLERATLLAADDADSLMKLGDFYLRCGDSEHGMSLLAEARLLRPQDAWLSDYLDLHETTTPFHEAFTVAPKEFLQWRSGPASGDDARYLVDSTVVKVFQTGLSSRFTQTVVEVNTREAAKDWRQFAVQFSTTNQRATLIEARVFRPDGTVEEATGRGMSMVSEPWYRLYYDMAALVVELPTLSPGDVVEYSFRVDDTSNQNAYADYFGDLSLLEGSSPKTLWKYVLISPITRKIHVGNHGAGRIARTTTRGDADVTEVFVARDVPAVVPEVDMPGETSGISYLHVSTYASWEDLGRWYRGLVRNQMLPDERIRAKTAELTRGIRTTAGKVGAIYDWVVTATRYVGLEFGIHGYKPYRAPLVVSRGFGDCKDKASLLVTMLRAAGIDAQFTLVRTRSMGPMDESPASLSVFNHAIAYVPSLDLWLDGTAEYHGTGDLPFEDQGALALRLTKDGVVLTTTPFTDPVDNSLETEVDVLLDPDGDANVEISTVATGANSAPVMRREFGTERTRRDRFESSLVKVFPSARLGELDISPLLDLEKPVEYHFTAFVPRFARPTESSLEVPLGDGLDLVKRYARLSSRRHDLVVGPSRRSSRKMAVHLPDGFDVKRLPSAAVIESDYGHMSLTVEKRGRKVVVEREFEITARVVPREEYSDFVSFCREVDEILAGTISLRRAR